MSDEPGFSEDFKRIKEDYLKTIPTVVQSMESQVNSLNEKIDQKVFSELRFHVHKLAGNAGTFGFQEVSDLCKGFDQKMTKMLENFSEEEAKTLLPELSPLVQKVKESFHL